MLALFNTSQMIIMNRFLAYKSGFYTPIGLKFYTEMSETKHFDIDEQHIGVLIMYALMESILQIIWC